MHVAFIFTDASQRVTEEENRCLAGISTAEGLKSHSHVSRVLSWEFVLLLNLDLHIYEVELIFPILTFSSDGTFYSPSFGNFEVLD